MVNELKLSEMKNFKKESKYRKLVTKSFWGFNSRLKVWVNNVTGKKGIFYPATRSFKIID